MTITIFPRAARTLLLAALLACAFALYSAAGADAAFKAGVYRGKTEQNAKISLKVLSSKKAVIKFSWEGAVMGCSDGTWHSRSWRAEYHRASRPWTHLMDPSTPRSATFPRCQGSAT